MVFNLGPTNVSVLATLNLTLATESLAIVSTVGSIRRSVISVPQASAKICREGRTVQLNGYSVFKFLGVPGVSVKKSVREGSILNKYKVFHLF